MYQKGPMCSSNNKRNNGRTLTNDIKKAYDKHQSKKSKPKTTRKKIQSQQRVHLIFFVDTFDMQAIQQTPSSLVSQLYYMILSNCYDLSIYNLANTKAACYLCSEVDAHKGSCEIGTCLCIFYPCHVLPPMLYFVLMPVLDNTAISVLIRVCCMKLILTNKSTLSITNSSFTN